MTRLCGGAVFVLCAVLWGRGRAAELYKRQRLTMALSAFAAFCGERISSFCDPLEVIFNSFENDVLRAEGFLGILREKGLQAALQHTAPGLSEESASLLSEFAKKLGGENGASQASLCAYTASRLEADGKRQADELAGRAKLYRLLPPLAALSAVILLV